MPRNLFRDAFISNLLEQDQQLPLPSAAEASGNVAASAEFTAGEEGAEAANYGSSEISPEDKQILQHAAQREMQMIKNLTTWIDQLDGMVDFLNGTHNDSIQMQLKRAVPDTIFDKMRTAEAKKIARVAKEISALAETFKGYLATSNEPKYRFV